MDETLEERIASLEEEIEDLKEENEELTEEVENLTKEVENYKLEIEDINDAAVIGFGLFATLIHAMITGKTFKELLDEVGFDHTRKVGNYDLEKIVENFIDNAASEFRDTFIKMGVPDEVVDSMFDYIKENRHLLWR